MDLGGRFRAADKLLRHWQLVAAVGRPEEWRPLEFSPDLYPEMRRRVLEAAHKYGGTEPHHEMLSMLAALEPPVLDPDPVVDDIAVADCLPPVLDPTLSELDPADAGSQSTTEPGFQPDPQPGDDAISILDTDEPFLD